MPLLDHFHPPLRGPRHWEGFHHVWAANIAQHLNREVLPPEFFAESEISLGPTLEIDVANVEGGNGREASGMTATAVWAPAKPLLTFPVDFARLDVCEVRVYEELSGAQLRAAIELVSPANKDRPGSRRTFAAKCAGYLKQAVSVVIIDVVTERTANLHADLLEALEVTEAAWESPTQLYAVAYRPVPVLKQQRIEAWPEVLTLGRGLPVLPLWLRVDLSVPLQLEETYATTCEGLRIPC
ncbi:MAG TPA: DUF4058 family protein [Gemmataceae bacterium]|nr:DUF4058 family protein [Gemmataceae bacterium]